MRKVRIGFESEFNQRFKPRFRTKSPLVENNVRFLWKAAEIWVNWVKTQIKWIIRTQKSVFVRIGQLRFKTLIRKEKLRFRTVQATNCSNSKPKKLSRALKSRTKEPTLVFGRPIKEIKRRIRTGKATKLRIHETWIKIQRTTQFNKSNWVEKWKVELTKLVN